jgi:hypothetical protein
MSFFEILCLSAAFGVLLAIVRFALLAFLPDHPLSRTFARLDRIGRRDA